MGTKSLPLSRRSFLIGSAAAASTVALGAMTGCAANQNTSIQGVDPSEVLVAYYSKTGQTQSIEGLETISKGHTEVMAEYIAEAVGCDTFKIKPTVDYPESFQETQDIALNEFARTIYHEISNFDELPKPMDQYKYLFDGALHLHAQLQHGRQNDHSVHNVGGRWARRLSSCFDLSRSASHRIRRWADGHRPVRRRIEGLHPKLGSQSAESLEPR